MFRAIIAFIISIFRKPETFSENKYKGMYRKPGEVIEDLEEIKLPEPQKVNKFYLWLESIKKNLATMSYDNTMEKIRDFLLMMFVVGVVSAGCFLLYKVIFASGVVEYCYIERWTYTELIDVNVKLPDDSMNKDSKEIPGPGERVITVYELKGHVDFRANREIGRFDNFDAALSAAQKLNCSMEQK